MEQRKITIIIFYIIGLAVLGWLLFGVFGIQALFYDKTVNEEVPDVVMKEEMSPTTTVPVVTSTTTTVPAVLPNVPKILARGTFGQGDNTYTISGKATVTEQNGVKTLSLTDFSVTNGPDLFVYIVRAPSADNKTVKDAAEAGLFVNLGALKGNKGNQTYTLPPGVELGDNTIVSIWCRRFSRNFGAAQLSTP